MARCESRLETLLSRMPELRGIEINADLECEMDGHSVHIRSDGYRNVVCLLPDARTLFGLRRVLRGRIPLRTLGQNLSLIGHTLDVHLAGKLIARFGHDADGRLPRILGFRSTELKLGQIVSLALSRAT